MSTALHVRSKLSADDYSKLPEIPGYKDELLEGERVLAPMAKFQHFALLDRLHKLLIEQFHEARVVRETAWRFESS